MSKGGQSKLSVHTGQWSDQKKADANVQRVVDKVKPAIISRLGLGSSCKITAMVYRTQVVAGMNYAIKAEIKSLNTMYYNIYVYESLPNPEVGYTLTELKETSNDAPLTSPNEQDLVKLTMGGYTSPQKADESTQKIVQKVKPAIVIQLGIDWMSEITATEYISQLVNGMNYVIRVIIQTPEIRYYDVYVFEGPFGGQHPEHCQLMSLKETSKDAPLKPPHS